MIYSINMFLIYKMARYIKCDSQLEIQKFKI